LRLYRAAAEFLGRRVSECWLVCVEENGVLAAQRVE
jgi:hypothetical protein